jgi:hypothetical protein
LHQLNIISRVMTTFCGWSLRKAYQMKIKIAKKEGIDYVQM